MQPGLHSSCTGRVSLHNIQPPWENYDGTPSAGELIEFLLDKLKGGGNVLLVGESDQGKSTVLKR